MEEMPSLNMLVQRLKVAILPLDLPYSGPITHSGEILTTGKSHRKKPDSDQYTISYNRKTVFKTFIESLILYTLHLNIFDKL